mgnify:CR=1 FL=1
MQATDEHGFARISKMQNGFMLIGVDNEGQYT